MYIIAYNWVQLKAETTKQEQSATAGQSLDQQITQDKHKDLK